MSQWVQSKYSKDAKKWEVIETHDHQWVVRSGLVPCGYHFLPKEEYIPCDPPERWETCTREVAEIINNGEQLSYSKYGPHMPLLHGYRWAWSEKDPDALIVQRRV